MTDTLTLEDEIIEILGKKVIVYKGEEISVESFLEMLDNIIN
jgi:hypothetical protein